MAKRTILKITEMVAGAAGLAAVLMPLRTSREILLFVAAIVVAIASVWLHLKVKRKNIAYWPDRPNFRN